MSRENERLAVVALGSNRGSSMDLMEQAVNRIRQLAASPPTVSSFWKTDPVNCPPHSPEFLNAVAAFEPASGITPEDLLERLLALESELGREPRRGMNAPRTMDLDLIAFGRETRNTPRLILPHPRAHLRRFVLAPLAEILPDFRAPGWERNASELLSRLPPEGNVVRI